MCKVAFFVVCPSFRLVRNLSDGFKEGFPTRFTCGDDSFFCAACSLYTDTNYVFIADLLEDCGLKVREPYVKPITGSRKLFEIRIKDKASIHRIFYFAFTGKKLIILHGFTKKTDKTPGREIVIAEKRMEEYLSRKD